jgi:hypothetical protein
MTKSEIYSWRLDPGLKRSLEEAARAEKTSIGGLLERIARDWLGSRSVATDEAELQRHLRAEVLKVVGTMRSGDRYGSERVNERFRGGLTEKHRRRQRDAPPRSD